MITVAIFINGNPLITRSARNVGKAEDGQSLYRVDTGAIIKHDRDEGAVVLAKLLLDTVEEP